MVIPIFVLVYHAVTPIFGQKSASVQASHLGLRAMQTCRPWWIMRWEKSIHSFLRHELHQVGFDLHRVVVRGEAEPAAEPADVRVDHHAGRFAEGDAEHDVGRLAADAGELRPASSSSCGHLAVVLVDQRRASRP